MQEKNEANWDWEIVTDRFLTAYYVPCASCVDGFYACGCCAKIIKIYEILAMNNQYKEK